MKTMKKLTCILCCIALIAALSGCAGSSPKGVIGDFCTAMQAFDVEKMRACIANTDGDFTLFDEDDDAMTVALFDCIKENSAKMTWKITECKTEKDSGTVTVAFHYVDASTAIRETVSEYFSKALSAAFDQGSEEPDETLFTDILQEKMTAEPVFADQSVTFPCVKTEDGWKISEVPEDMYDVFTCNILGALTGLFGG